MISKGAEEDDDVRAALAWFAAVSGNPQAFVERLTRAQEAYRTVTASPNYIGQDSKLDATQDVVGAFLAQAKSLLDDRRSYDLSLASQIIPWLKQIGRNANVLPYIPGASERAIRMLRAETVAPDGVMLELVMASNYAADGFDVSFIEEALGQARTPDLRICTSGLPEPIFVECKRLRRGQYEIREQAQHQKLFRKAAELINERRLSVHLDVTYTKELREVPVGYVADRLMRALSSPIITPRGYPWKDDCGFGIVRPANLAAVHQDICHSTLYFGPKLARLLSGNAVRESGYQLAAQVVPDKRDPRFIDSIQYGSVVTWQCIAPAAIQKKGRYVKTKLAEVDQQLKGHGAGIAHLAMDMELQCESSDLRRARNIEAITAFEPDSDLLAIYVHYLVPRISESHAWIVDETVDRFGQGDDPVPSLAIFPGSATIGNEFPAWKQEV
jgi:hypothetical protein